jgi:hypothetical protein
VLIVDDYYFNITVLEVMLKKVKNPERIIHFTALNGQEAYEVYRDFFLMQGHSTFSNAMI